MFTPWAECVSGFDEPYELRCETTWSQPQLIMGVDTGAGGSPVYVYEKRTSFSPRAASWWTGEMEGMAIVVGLVAVASIFTGNTVA